MGVDGGEVLAHQLRARQRARVQLLLNVGEWLCGYAHALLAVFKPAGGLAGIFHFLLDVAHGILEFAHAFAQTFHEFRDLLRAKEHQDKNADEEDFLETNTTQKQKDRFHL